MAIENGKIEVRSPLKKYQIEAKKIANNIGDSHLLSETDLDLLALALELKRTGANPKIVTDDYSMQNVASQMKIEFIPLSTSGIKQVLEWARYCPACYKKYTGNYNSSICSICGTKLKRKPTRKERSKQAN